MVKFVEAEGYYESVVNQCTHSLESCWSQMVVRFRIASKPASDG